MSKAKMKHYILKFDNIIKTNIKEKFNNMRESNFQHIALDIFVFNFNSLKY